MGVSNRRRGLGAAIIAIGAAGWLEAIFLVLSDLNTYQANYLAWALVPISGAVVCMGGLLAGLWG